MHRKGKPTEQDIVDIKAELNGKPIFRWDVPNSSDSFIFTVLTPDVLNNIRAFISSEEQAGRNTPFDKVNEIVYHKTVVWPSLAPEELFQLPVGLIPSLVKKVQEKSAFIEVDIYGRALAPDTSSFIIQDFAYWPAITDEELTALKAETPFSLFRARIGKWSFIIRPMTRIDIQVSQQASDNGMSVCKSVVMWPKSIKWDIIPAGVIEKLGETAHKISGWDLDSETEAVEL